MPGHPRRTVPILGAFVLACNAQVTPRPPDAASPIRTDRAEYTARRVADGVEVEIPFTYTNRTGRTVYVVNCNGIAPPGLQKRVDGEWMRAWSAAVPLCLSPPIVIGAGRTYTDTLRVFAGTPSSGVAPVLEVEEVEGVYRLVWENVVHDYDDARPGFGEPLPLEARISNPFRLEEG